MTEKEKYCLIVKTGDSELRAMQNLSSESLSKTLPIVELTRGRARNIGTKELPQYAYPYDSKKKRIKEIFGGHRVALDVTSDVGLSSQEIDDLFNYEGGYRKWIELVRELREAGLTLIPSILINYEDENLEENVKSQIYTLSSEFPEVMYRSSLERQNSECIDDVSLICECLSDESILWVVLDCGWVPPASYRDPARICIERIKNIKKIAGDKKIKIVVCATTFPNNVSEIGDDVSDTFDLREIDLYEIVRGEHAEVIYGDYASINPIRNDQIRMTRGWIPRIDVALEREVYYYRERRGSREYSDVYTSVAKKVMLDKRFGSVVESWGIQQIRNCASGGAPSATPSFWISVRMNSHIEQQIHRLGLRDEQ